MYDIATVEDIRNVAIINFNGILTEEYNNSTTVAFSFSTSIAALCSTSSQLVLEVSLTPAKSQSGISSTALEQA